MITNKLKLSSLDIEQKSMECLTNLDRYIQHNFDDLINDFLIQFARYCRKITLMQEAGKKGPLGFIHFSQLRTNTQAKRHMIRLDAYDENWYGDRVECSGEYNACAILIWFEEFANAMEAAGKNLYSHKKRKDVKRAIFAESKKYLFILAELIRIGLKKAAETEWFQGIKREAVFVVCIGEYQDTSDILYKEDASIKDPQTVKHFLEDKDQSIYTHEICENLDLTYGCYEGDNLLFANFTGCDFSHSSFNNSLILNSNFSNTVMKNTKLENAKIFHTDFSGATLNSVSFQGSELKNLSFAGAKLINVDFNGLLLAEELDFDRCTLLDTMVPISVEVK